MNSLEAKFILEACRAGDVDESDPRIAEALQAMESDPELAHWFAVTQELDRTIVAKLKTVPVPEDLLARINANGLTSAPEPRRLSRRHWLGLAAAAAVLATPAALLLTRARPGKLDTFRHDMGSFMDLGWDKTFDLMDPEFANVKAWLESRRDAVQLDVPSALAASRTIGCKTFSWHGHKTVLICFSPKGAGAIVHVIILPHDALVDPPAEEPQLARLPNWNSAVWTRADKVYLALTTADPDKLTGCL
jgi:hypothetical protein